MGFLDWASNAWNKTTDWLGNAANTVINKVNSLN